MMFFKNNTRQTFVTVLWMFLVFFMGVFLFSEIVTLPGIIDMQVHNAIIEDIIKGNCIMPPHFLYFSLVILLSKISSITSASILILSFALSFKLLATKQFLLDGFQKAEGRREDMKQIINKIIFPLAFFLLFLTNMPNKLFGANSIPPISWHNSTVIMLMPFCLWLFKYSFRYLHEENNRTLFFIGLFGILSIIIKPNFILVFIPVFSFFLIKKYKFSFATYKALAIIALFVIAIGAQYVYTYNYLTVHALSKMYNNIRIVIGPFEAWHRISHNLFFSFFAWALYPILFLALYYKSAVRSLLYNYAFCFFIVAMLIFIVFTEKEAKGSDIAAVNFIWQVIICHYIWFLVSLIEHIKIISIKKIFLIKDYILIGVGSAYMLSGVIYVLRTIVF